MYIFRFCLHVEGGRFYCMYVPPSSTDAFQCPYRHRQALIYVLLPLYKDRQTLFRAFFIYIICNFVPREYRPIYKRMQPPPPNNSPLPRICDVILHYISVDRHFSVQFYLHFSFLHVYIEGGRSYCMYVPPRRQTLFNVHTDIDRRLLMYSCLYIRVYYSKNQTFIK